MKGLLDATKDENSVMFNRKNNAVVAEIKEHIERQMATSRQVGPPSGVADEIRKLKVLLDEGVITQDEFDAQKQRLLS